MKTRLIAISIAMVVASCAFAEWVLDGSIELAAESWLSSDSVAQLTMKDLSFCKLEHRGSLRVVRLSPTGYIVMSGSDVSDPVISFSRNNFIEPENVSPFYAMLASSDANVAKREAGGGDRTAKWTALIGGRDGSKPIARHLQTRSPEEDASAVLIEPFMTTHWNQWQPWNDFCPVVDPDEEDMLYRTRCACGCVATAVAQQIAHFKWPWNTGRRDSYVHTFNRDGEGDPEESIVIRFDGHVPFEWDLLLDAYSWWWGDARGHVDELERYPIGRFILWVDHLTCMNFGKNGSGSHFAAVREPASDWYEQWEDLDLVNDYDASAAKIKADLGDGVPVHVGVPGHSVVAHGWASDDEYDYVYLNYGWGGSSDGWYILDGRNADTPICGAGVGFRPKKMVQLEHLPNVCNGEIEVRWHLPDCYTNVVTGFDARAYSYANAQDETCDFSGELGVSSSQEKLYITNKVADVGNDTPFLWFSAWSSGVYDLPGERKLTGSSILSYRVSSSNVGGDREVEIQASFDGGEWQTVSRPLLNKGTGSISWVEQKAFLGEHAGEHVRFRIRSSWGGGSVLFDDFRYSDVLQPKTAIVKHAGADARSCVLGAFAGGIELGVSVTPIFADGDGVESEWEYTRMAGTARLPMPTQINAYTTNDLVYTAGDTVWSVFGMPEGGTTIRSDSFVGGFGIALPGTVTKDTQLEFSWTVAGYYGGSGCYDVIAVMFADLDGKETVFWCVTNSEKRTEMQLERLSLANFAGKSGRVSLSYNHSGGNYTGDNNRMRFYAPQITNIQMPVFPQGNWETEPFAACPAPQILSVKGRDGMEIDEGLYREIVIGEDQLRVRCSPSVTELKAYPSHLTYLADEDVTVEMSAPGEFLVKMDTSKAPRRQRMILTLEASNANGTCAYRDVSLRFDEESAISRLDRWRKIASFSGKPVAAYTFDNSGTSNSGTGSFSLGGAGDCVAYEDSPLGRAICHTTSHGPWVSSDLNMPDGWTILAVAKTSVTNNGVVFAVGATWSGSSRSGLALVSGDMNTVKLSHWVNRNFRRELSVDVPNATEKYHAYAIRGNGADLEFFVDGINAGSLKLDSMPDYGIQLFSVCSGLASTGLKNGAGEAIDDWRMYYSALPDPAIAAYAATLMQFDGKPAGVAVEEGGTVVPESWFAKYRPGQTITRERLLAKAANGRSVWECYVAGLDPDDADDDLVADITFENGIPKVSFANGEKSNRVYRIYATKSLDGFETPLDVTDVKDLSGEPYSDYRFFRISAELP